MCIYIYIHTHVCTSAQMYIKLHVCVYIYIIHREREREYDSRGPPSLVHAQCGTRLQRPKTDPHPPAVGKIMSHISNEKTYRGPC